MVWFNNFALIFFFLLDKKKKKIVYPILEKIYSFAHGP